LTTGGSAANEKLTTMSRASYRISMPTVKDNWALPRCRPAGSSNESINRTLLTMTKQTHNNNNNNNNNNN
jgi:hypothetical protein